MKIEEVKKIVADMGLSAGSMEQIDKIIVGYKDEDEVGDDVVNQIIAIADLEMDANKIAADVYDEGVLAADEFLDKVDLEANKLADELEKGVKKSE